MAIALLGHESQYRDGSSSDDLTLNYTSHDGAYRKMIVIITTVAVTSDMMISGVKYNDVSLTQLGSGFQMDTTLTYKNMQVFYLENAGFSTTGAHDLVADVNNTIASIIMEVIEISGAVQGVPDYDTNIALDDINNMQVPTTIDNTWFISGFFWTRNESATPESGQTQIEYTILGGKGNALAMSYHNITPPNAKADSNWALTAPSSNYQICIIVPAAIIPSKNSAILAAAF